MSEKVVAIYVTRQFRNKIKTKKRELTYEKFIDKKLLEIFIKETIMDLKFYSTWKFSTLMPSFQSEIHIDSKKLELLEKVIKTRIDLLQKRDPKLVIMFNDLITNQLLSDY